jgi:hypothetical protein
MKEVELTVVTDYSELEEGRAPHQAHRQRRYYQTEWNVTKSTFSGLLLSIREGRSSVGTTAFEAVVVATAGQDYDKS